MHFHYITYIATLLNKKPCPGGHEIYNFVRPILNYYHTLTFSEPNPGVEKKILKEIHQFYTFHPKITFPWGWGVGVMTFTFSCLLTLQIPHTKFGYDLPRSSWEEDVNGRRTTIDDGRQPKAIIRVLYENWMVLICKASSPIHPKMLCAKFGWNWPNGSREEGF